MTHKIGIQVFLWNLASAICAGIGTDSVWIGFSVFAGITAVLWPQLSKSGTSR